MYNILTEPLIRMVKSDGSHDEASLPKVYAALMADKVEAFPALRPHQRHAWHAFLVQLGAMAMHRGGVRELPENAETWAKLIRGLTSDFPGDEPWQLVVDDILKPAFMQPPASSWVKFDKKDLLWTPDKLDMLDTAKNHDLKTSVAMAHEPEDWAFALVTMQTMNGQVGRGNYPIARMNSGDGSRTAFSISPSLRIGVHVRRDMTVMLERANEMFEGLPYQWSGISILWTERWDGEREAMPLSSLHPFHIEICRRRRLCVDSNGQLNAMKAASDGRRVAANKLRGVVGDPWTLVTTDKEGVKALTLQTDSFNYKKITNYLTLPDWRIPALFSPTDEERSASEVHLVMRGIRRTKGGQTERYLERIIPIRLRTVQVFGRPEGMKELGDIARERIEQAGKVEAILKDAIATCIAQGKDIYQLEPKPRALFKLRDRGEIKPWLNKLDEILDARFFEDLQDEFEANDRGERERIRKQWLSDFVVPEALNILDVAQRSLPCPVIERYHAYASAQNLFNGRIYREFEISLDNPEED